MKIGMNSMILVKSLLDSKLEQNIKSLFLIYIIIDHDKYF